MGIAASELSQHVIRPTLEYLGRYSRTAETLLLGIAACQSALGEVLDNAEGFGLYRITETSHRNIWDQHLALNPDLASLIRGLASQHAFLHAPNIELTVNLRYSTAIAWMLIEAKSLELPQDGNIHALALIWRTVFQPQGHTRDFVQAWQQRVERNSHAA